MPKKRVRLLRSISTVIDAATGFVVQRQRSQAGDDRKQLAAAGTDLALTGYNAKQRVVPRKKPRLERDRVGRVLVAQPLSEAMGQFIAWLQVHNFDGSWRPQDLWQFYLLLFCQENGLVPPADTMFNEFSRNLAQHCARSQVSVYENGKRRRLTIYTIRPAKDASGTVVKLVASRRADE